MLYWIILGVVESLLASSLHPSVITTVHGGMWLSRKSPGLALDNHISGIFTRLKVEINLHHLTRRYRNIKAEEKYNEWQRLRNIQKTSC